MSVPLLRRRKTAIVLILGGNVLLIVAMFGPWFRLSTSFGDTAGERSYGLWALMRPKADAGSAIALALAIFLPFVVTLVSSVASLVVRAQRGRVILGFLAIVLAMACLFLALCFVAGAPTGLAMGWPYYTTRGIEYGAWAALVGFACVALGVVTNLGE